jgi:hypothetical protein
MKFLRVYLIVFLIILHLYCCLLTLDRLLNRKVEVLEVDKKDLIFMGFEGLGKLKLEFV